MGCSKDPSRADRFINCWAGSKHAARGQSPPVPNPPHQYLMSARTEQITTPRTLLLATHSKRTEGAKNGGPFVSPRVVNIFSIEYVLDVKNVNWDLFYDLYWIVKFENGNGTWNYARLIKWDEWDNFIAECKIKLHDMYAIVKDWNLYGFFSAFFMKNLISKTLRNKYGENMETHLIKIKRRYLMLVNIYYQNRLKDNPIRP